MKLNIFLAGVLMLFCMSAQAQETMYKWTNSAGIVQYSQFPPEGIADDRIEKVGGKKKKASTGPRTLADIEGLDDDEDSEEDSEEETANVDAEDEDGEEEEEVAANGEEALAIAEKRAEAEKQRVLAEERKICEIATKNLIGLESRPIIRVKEGDDYRVLNKKEKAAKLSETREQITKYCG